MKDARNVRKKLNAPSSLGTTVTREIRAAAEEAVARARLAGVAPAGAEASELSELSAKATKALEEAVKAQRDEGRKKRSHGSRDPARAFSTSNKN